MKPISKSLIWGLFAAYLLLLAWIILMKMAFSFADLSRIRALNWVPFAESYYSDGKFNAREIVENLLFFVPMGLFLSMLKERWPLWVKLLCIFGASLALEALQYLFALGVSDVTDLMSNTAGGLCGLALYALALGFSKNRVKTDRFFFTFALIGGACGVAFMLLLLLVN